MLRYGFLPSYLTGTPIRGILASEWFVNQSPRWLPRRRGLPSPRPALSLPNEPIFHKGENRAPPSMASAACGALRALSAAPGAPDGSGPAPPASPCVGTPSALPMLRQCKLPDWPVMSGTRRTRQRGRVMSEEWAAGPQKQSPRNLAGSPFPGGSILGVPQGHPRNTFDLTTTKHYDIIAHGL